MNKPTFSMNAIELQTLIEKGIQQYFEAEGLVSFCDELASQVAREIVTGALWSR